MSKYKEFEEFKLIIFDLDDTLYPEKDYLFAAYNTIADYTRDIVGGTKDSYYEYLRSTFEREGRNGLFDKYINFFNLNRIVQIGDLLHLMRTCRCELHVYNKMNSLLKLLSYRGVPITVLTNGNLQQQKNKVNSLRLSQLYPGIDVFYASEIEPKPSPVGVFTICDKYKVTKKDVLLIGDSEIDEETALRAGISFKNVSLLLNN